MDGERALLYLPGMSIQISMPGPRTLAGRAMILALAAGLGCDIGTAPEPRVAAHLSILDGDAQAGTVSQPLVSALRVRVLDQEGDPLPEAPVEWSAEHGTLGATVTTTDSVGLAATTLTLGETARLHTVRASVENVGEVVFRAEAMPGPPAEVGLSNDSLAFIALGDTLALSAVVRDRFGNRIEDSSVTWSASDTAVAAVDGAGRVVSRGPGEAEISARPGDPHITGVRAEATVVVEQRVAAVALGPTTPDTMRTFGGTAPLTASATDPNGFEVAATFNWSSLDPAVATVDAEGTITAAGRGTAAIVATAGSAADTVTVAVIPWGRVTVSMELNRWEIYDIVFPIMQRHGLTGNLEVAIQYIGDEDRISVPQIREMHNAGWAVVPHSVTLRNLTELSNDEMRNEVLGSQAWVRDRGFRGASVFIVPGHNAGEREMALIRQNFSAARTRGYLHVRSMVNWPVERPYEITGLEGEGFLDSAEGLAELRQLWLRAIHEGRLLEIYFHRVKPRQAAAFETFIRDVAVYRSFVKTFAELFED